MPEQVNALCSDIPEEPLAAGLVAGTLIDPEECARFSCALVPFRDEKSAYLHIAVSYANTLVADTSNASQGLSVGR